MQSRDHDASYALCVRSVLRTVSVGVLTVVALVGCGSKEEPQVVAPVQPVKREKVPDDPTAKMARAVTVGSAAAPINLKYEILSKPIVGSPVEIELAVMPTLHADSITIAFAGSPGLTPSAETAPTIDAVKVGQIERVKLSVQAQRDGVYYMTVTTTLYTAGTSEVRNFAIPIIVSAPAPAAGESAEPVAAAVAPKKS